MTGEVQSRSGSSFAGVVGGFAVGAITAGATAYYFLQVGHGGPMARLDGEEPQMKTPLKSLGSRIQIQFIGGNMMNMQMARYVFLSKPFCTSISSVSSVSREMICTLLRLS